MTPKRFDQAPEISFHGEERAVSAPQWPGAIAVAKTRSREEEAAAE